MVASRPPSESRALTERRRGARLGGAAFVYLPIALVALLAVPQGGAAQSATETTVGRDWIRPIEVPERADALIRRLEDAQPSAAVKESLHEIERSLPKLTRQLDAFLDQATDAMAQNVSPAELEDLRRELIATVAPFSDFRATLSTEAERVAGALDFIERSQLNWTETRDREETTAAGDVVVRRVEDSVVALDAAEKSLRAWRSRVLAASDQVIQRVGSVDTVLDKLNDAAVEERDNILEPDSPPLWARRLGAELRSELPRAPAEIAAYGKTTAAFLMREPRPLIAQLLLAAFLMISLGRFATHARQRLESEEVASRAARLLERPYSIALLLALLVSPVFHPLAPRRITQLAAIFALLPAARILTHVVTPASVPAFVGLFVLLVLDRLGAALEGLPSLSRVTFLLILVLGWAGFFRVSRRAPSADGSTWQRPAARVATVLLALSILAEVGGWTHLADILGRGLISAAIAGVYVYAAGLAVATLLTYALVSRTAQRSHLIGRHMAVLQRRIDHLLHWLGTGVWLYFVVTGNGLRDVVVETLSRGFSASVTVGALSLSVGGILAFILVVLAVPLLARIATAILEEDVYPRTHLPRGVPYALSTLVRYGLYALGFLFALAAAGVPLGQVTILLGGLGVGIGLGLQDLVKNFAAGLTLLLERRIHVGDAVEIPSMDITGTVLSIGTRASVVRTWSGAEVLVPNADLTSSSVTNWTLSDRLCRIEVPVGVAYGTDPDRVVEVLLEAAASNEHVLSTPPPDVLFQNFGDSSLGFIVRGWIEGYDRKIPLTSDLGRSVHRALYAAGITIPFPQRDLNLANVSAPARSALADLDREARREPSGGEPE